MNNPDCKEVIFIDCMCNNGIYKDDNDEQVKGTPIRVARVITDAATLYFNDSDPQKIAKLQDHLPTDTNNFHIVLSCEDGNQRLKELRPSLLKRSGLHYLLFLRPLHSGNRLESSCTVFFWLGRSHNQSHGF